MNPAKRAKLFQDETRSKLYQLETREVKSRQQQKFGFRLPTDLQSDDFITFVLFKSGIFCYDLKKIRSADLISRMIEDCRTYIWSFYTGENSEGTGEPTGVIPRIDQFAMDPHPTYNSFRYQEYLYYFDEESTMHEDSYSDLNLLKIYRLYYAFRFQKILMNHPVIINESWPKIRWNYHKINENTLANLSEAEFQSLQGLNQKEWLALITFYISRQSPKNFFSGFKCFKCYFCEKDLYQLEKLVLDFAQLIEIKFGFYLTTKIMKYFETKCNL